MREAHGKAGCSREGWVELQYEIRDPKNGSMWQSLNQAGGGLVLLEQGRQLWEAGGKQAGLGWRVFSITPKWEQYAEQGEGEQPWEGRKWLSLSLPCGAQVTRHRHQRVGIEAAFAFGELPGWEEGGGVSVGVD